MEQVKKKKEEAGQEGEGEGGVDDQQVYPTSIAEDIPFRPISFLLFCLPTQPYHHSVYNICWNSLFAGVQVQVYLLSGSLLSVYWGPMARTLADECDTIEPRASSQSC